jgi:peptidase E
VRLPRSGDPREDTAATDAVRSADYVFAGPGSPSYALRHWRASGLAWALREKVESGGALSFASAAAVTMGAFAAPIYEIYKAGHDPNWLPGLDLLAVAGLRVALVPHFDNTEGRTHDTRYCYIGERRFRQLEDQLPADAWVLGIDERTALIIDLGEALAEVRGPGRATVRRRGRERHLGAGSTFPIAALAPPRSRRPSPLRPREPARDDVETGIARALDRGDLRTAVAAILELERQTEGPADPRVEGRHALHSAILRLGEVAAQGRSERSIVEALVETLLELRARARNAGDWSTADEIREALTGAGLAIHDTSAGPAWERAGEPPGRRS